VASLHYVVTMDQDRRILKSLIDWKTSGVPTSLYTKLTKIKIDIWEYIYMQPYNDIWHLNVWMGGPVVTMTTLKCHSRVAFENNLDSGTFIL
jgi:hypothetical protein